MIVGLAGVAASAQAAGPYPPSCRPNTPTSDPPYACVQRSYVSDRYVTPVKRGHISVTHSVVGHGQYSYVKVSVKVAFSVALAECPGGGVPLTSIPCVMDAPNFGNAGRYLPHQPRLGTNDDAYEKVSCPTQATHGVCTLDFRVYGDQVSGEYVAVITLSVGELTKNPANDLGQSGFEFAIAVHVPEVPTAHRQ